MSRQERRYAERSAGREHRQARARFQVRLEISEADAATFPADEREWTEADHRRFATFVRFRENDGDDGAWIPMPSACAQA
jgi:hypothetical protein